MFPSSVAIGASTPRTEYQGWEMAALWRWSRVSISHPTGRPSGSERAGVAGEAVTVLPGGRSPIT
ncbi:MAG TPA: hypothetical protein VGW74_19025 [Propionibacteriaceae bacterium]|nr:hypothetical protein [Propionibacteriaceae bacterium]